MRPVFLFYMGIIIFVIGSTAGEVDRLFTIGKMAVQMIIEELTTIVGIKAQEREREHFFDVFDLFQDTFFSFAPDSPLFSPSGGDIDEINGISEHTHEGITAMSYRVGFEKTRS